METTKEKKKQKFNPHHKKLVQKNILLQK